jgi:hypothetical protein
MRPTAIDAGRGPASLRRASRGRVDGSRFDTHLDEAIAAEPATPAAASPVFGIDALLSLQGIGGDGGGGGRRAIAYGNEILDRLELLRLDILDGRIPAGRLEELAQVLRSGRSTVVDERLSALLDEIELRAEIELAKLRVAAGI